jgi:hypothetical protein
MQLIEETNQTIRLAVRPSEVFTMGESEAP